MKLTRLWAGLVLLLAAPLAAQTTYPPAVYPPRSILPNYVTSSLPTCSTGTRGLQAYDTTLGQAVVCTGSAYVATGAAAGSIVLIGAGTVTAPSMAFLDDADGTGTGWYRSAANVMSLSNNGVLSYSFAGTSALFAQGSYAMNTSGYFITYNTGQYCFGSAGSVTTGTACDTGLTRLGASGVVALTNGTQTTRRGYLGGGAAVASATALPVPTGAVFHVTGTTVITSITTTNLGSGACFTMIFDGVTTVTDGSNLVLAGNFVTTADDTLSVCFDGTNFYETARAVN